jgi:hypothetical protein
MFHHNCPLAVKPASTPLRLGHKKKFDSLLIDMLPFDVTIPPTVPQRSEIPEGLMNYPVYHSKPHTSHLKCVCVTLEVSLLELRVPICHQRYEINLTYRNSHGNCVRFWCQNFFAAWTFCELYGKVHLNKKVKVIVHIFSKKLGATSNVRCHFIKLGYGGNLAPMVGPPLKCMLSIWEKVWSFHTKLF